MAVLQNTTTNSGGGLLELVDDLSLETNQSTGSSTSSSSSSNVNPVTSGSLAPVLGDMPKMTDCEKKWQVIEKVSKFSSYEAMLKAKEEFLKSCNLTIGSSAIVEPEIITTTNPILGNTSGTLPNLGTFLGSLTGGGSVANSGASAGSVEQITENPKEKKSFPYWILIAGLVGGYLIFRKK